jgi:GNAT superfamily N-acetyltransferase
MAAFKIIIEAEPDADLCKAIATLLREYNDMHTGKTVVDRFAVSLRDSGNDAVIGGLWGESYRGWFYIDMLIVPDALRKCGIGTSLMNDAEAAARKRGCVGIWLDTFTFQAPAFYEKLGYQLMGKLPDFPKGHDRRFYFKKIDA